MSRDGDRPSRIETTSNQKHSYYMLVSIRRKEQERDYSTNDVHL